MAGRTPCPTTHLPGKLDPMAAAPSPNPHLPGLIRENPRVGLGEEREQQARGAMGQLRALGVRENKAPPPATCTQSCPAVPRGRTPLTACQSPATSFPPALPAQISMWDTCFLCTARFPGTETADHRSDPSVTWTLPRCLGPQEDAVPGGSSLRHCPRSAGRGSRRFQVGEGATGRICSCSRERQRED